MSGSQFERKLRFMPYFPYGYCSELATRIAGSSNPYAGLMLLGNDPDSLIAQLKQYRQRTLYKARDLVEKGYSKNSTLVCGTPSVARTFRSLTTEGLFALIEVPDEATVDDNEDAGISENIKGGHFRSTSYASYELREILYDYATSEYASDQEAFHELILDYVMAARVTPLTSAIDLAEDVKINLAKYSENQRYNIWRLSHINAMFQANQYLTYVDRRPYDTGFAIDGIVDETTFRAYQTKHGITLAAFTYHALTSWYHQNPGYYRLAQQYPVAAIDAQNASLITPAFYSALELPYAKHDNTILLSNTAHGRRQVVNAIHVGLAAGKHVNYACYHTNIGKFKWLPKREQHAKSVLTAEIQQMKMQNPKILYNDHVDFAMVFCTSHHQFKALFARTLSKHVQYKKFRPATDTPYTSMHVIPINDSGAVLLWYLMEYSPIQAEQQIHNDLVAREIGFDYHVSRFYPLTYQGIPVFSGYTMDIAKIHRALEDHLDGVNFYICCFPDQVAWYRQLFPGKIFL